ncbi:aminodeoxychorismate lyase apoprotein [Tahibacter aquaticus]|uniref:Aminodeoxychorismate lyase n=2 Tax=Tahibacter aquaticus TaxID=520092 RepID=A0A4R6YNX7_9GAMM|nr:aminodeoxychorismate lyase [Tahibacter aquaticus]TDR39375.1 aminodeoxychorismate lyase apoprotein [Tahibacter aquaticus]
MRIRVNGEACAQLPAQDRGLLYGDGLFETVLFRQGNAPLWPRHAERLLQGLARLRIAAPDMDALLAEAGGLCSDLDRAVVRISITRGSGERGYALPLQPVPTRILMAAAAPPPPRDWYVQGIRVRCCSLQLAAQPVLAGMKHLNRLEQVLARAEWTDAAIVEGLLGDREGHVVSATAANLFACVDGQLLTPALDRCGVAGVARAEVLARRDAAVRNITWEELMRAEEIFLTSSVRGIVPVRAVDAREFAVGAMTHSLQREWQALGLQESAGG